MSDTAIKQEPLTDPGEPDEKDNENDEKPEAVPAIREYIVFVETGPDAFKRLGAVNAGDPGSAVKAAMTDPQKRYAVVASRYWQVGKPAVKQITQVSIEFE